MSAVKILTDLYVLDDQYPQGKTKILKFDGTTTIFFDPEEGLTPEPALHLVAGKLRFGLFVQMPSVTRAFTYFAIIDTSTIVRNETYVSPQTSESLYSEYDSGY